MRHAGIQTAHLKKKGKHGETQIASSFAVRERLPHFSNTSARSPAPPASANVALGNVFWHRTSQPCLNTWFLPRGTEEGNFFISPKSILWRFNSCQLKAHLSCSLLLFQMESPLNLTATSLSFQVVLSPCQALSQCRVPGSAQRHCIQTSRNWPRSRCQTGKVSWKLPENRRLHSC